MALRDQPYLPLYVQDFLTDEKLAECTASATGVYIRLMCLMHKSEQYGKILLRQKERQNKNIAEVFAQKLTKHMPFSESEIREAITELLEVGIIFYDDFALCQKRMIHDNEISCKRSKSGKKGAEITNRKSLKKESERGGCFAEAKPSAKVRQNRENENEIHSYENKDEISVLKEEESYSEITEQGSEISTLPVVPAPSEVVQINPHAWQPDKTLTECKAELLKSQSWLEQVTMNKRLTSIRDTEVWLIQFFSTLAADGITHKGVADAKKHFNRWLGLQLQNKTTTNANNKSTTSRQDEAIAGFSSRLEARNNAFLARQQQESD